MACNICFRLKKYILLFNGCMIIHTQSQLQITFDRRIIEKYNNFNYIKGNDKKINSSCMKQLTLNFWSAKEDRW
jgi:hypothetical protein